MNVPQTHTSVSWLVEESEHRLLSGLGPEELKPDPGEERAHSSRWRLGGLETDSHRVFGPAREDRWGPAGRWVSKASIFPGWFDTQGPPGTHIFLWPTKGTLLVEYFFLSFIYVFKISLTF